MPNKNVTLQPLAIRIFDQHGILSPSKLRKVRKIPYQEFLDRYADHPVKLRVCLDKEPDPDTIFSRSREITVYGYGYDCW
jgi:aminopeptidase C